MKLWIVTAAILLTTGCGLEKSLHIKRAPKSTVQQRAQDVDTIAVLYSEPKQGREIGLKDTADAKRKKSLVWAPVTELSPLDLALTDSLLRRAVEEHNDRIRKSGHPERVLKLKGYRRQYIPYSTANGEKIIWVNCFCSKYHEHWHTHIVSVFDGGGCYFNVWVDLARHTWYAMEVNGEA